jgi:CheY-like chemotaxis protein
MTESGPGSRVLIVEDDADTAECLALVLNMEGYETRTAHDGPAALSLGMSFHPDVVLLDLGLPGMDGYEVAVRYRSTPELKRIALVALSGHGYPSHRKLAMAAGCDAHLMKPVEVAELQQAISPFVRPKRAPS